MYQKNRQEKFNLNISGFEGPLDLLLDLSKKQKVDITKLSILELANQYLDFIKENIKSINLSADYLVMASFLAFLKSKLLLPKDEIDDQLNELEENFTNRLIHYNAIKIAVKKIESLYQEDKDFYTRKIKSDFYVSHKIVINAKMHDLLKTYLTIDKIRKKFSIQIEKNKLFSVNDGKEWIDFFFQGEYADWKNLLDFMPSNIQDLQLKKSAAVSIILASLTLAQEGKIEIQQNYVLNSIEIKSKT